MLLVEELAKKHRPKMIITGASSYSRKWDWAAFRKIADDIGAILLSDMAHIAGLVAADIHESPVPFAHVVTSTTHKTLRGPRGGIILSSDCEIGKKVDRALFPGIQGGPLMNNIAAKAVSFAEVLEPSFKKYAFDVVKNAQIFAEKLKIAGGKLVSGGTDNHLMILDCQSFGMTGKEAEKFLEEANVFISVSALLDDPSWKQANGIRIGTPYITTLGFDEISEFADLFIEAFKKKNSQHLKEYVIENARRLFGKFL